MPAKKHLRSFVAVIASLGLAAALAAPTAVGANPLSDVPQSDVVSDAVTTDVAATTDGEATNGVSSLFFGCAYDSVLQTLTPSYDSTLQAFSLFGDQDWYALVSQGDFETMPTWSKGGNVTLAASSDPFALTGTMGESSLRLRSGGWVRTPLMCVNLQTPHLRFVANASGAGELDVDVRLVGCPGRFISRSRSSLSPSDHSGWEPSAKIDLNTSCLGPGRSGIVDVRFRSQGDWLIDDVMIDPYKRG